MSASPLAIGTSQLTMKLANKNSKRSWAWLSGVFDSFTPGWGEPDWRAMFPFENEERWVMGLVPWVQAFWEFVRLYSRTCLDQ